MTFATGEQFDLRRETSSGGTVEATITQVAAGIRRLRVHGVDIMPPYDESRPRPLGSGMILVPWPNRVRDGRWMLDGSQQQLALTEPAKNNASHGLLRFSPYSVGASTGSTLRLEATVFPQTGYPFLLDTAVTYRLVDTGIEVTHTITNGSDAAAPVAIGAHPFFTIGDVAPEELTVRVNVTTRFESDDRSLPIGEVPVDGRYDLRGGVRLGDLELDTGFGGAVMHDGISEHSIAAPDGRRVTVWGDDNFAYWQVFTTELYPGQSKAVAIEPMTAPADALNSGTGLRWLAPGATWEASWGVRADGFTPA
ncbi:galactose mutarotase [Mycetocola manganoxydans]|uniref:Galactose mutarotase n=1 Tax=Mycetocola manganoxydans TaxID=699879 RepID=A0A3L6ZW38_9MICO|nr:aldose 1-epimerase family protein [Mycetocola manganoxydans]RLP72089.1 galactose mutarotase [Mycetocola manganoxydans]GHD47888.1 aldose 1-epimerase [Mycetocola manganoxydans]